ncbi:MAG: hypothetical protein JXR36_03325 [Bacteroidales bacterium]|nr:hypothetical protein [Bacteroidales bacterium]
MLVFSKRYRSILINFFAVTYLVFFFTDDHVKSVFRETVFSSMPKELIGAVIRTFILHFHNLLGFSLIGATAVVYATRLYRKQSIFILKEKENKYFIAASIVLTFVAAFVPYLKVYYYGGVDAGVLYSSWLLYFNLAYYGLSIYLTYQFMCWLLDRMMIIDHPVEIINYVAFSMGLKLMLFGLQSIYTSKIMPEIIGFITFA